MFSIDAAFVRDGYDNRYAPLSWRLAYGSMNALVLSRTKALDKLLNVTERIGWLERELATASRETSGHICDRLTILESVQTFLKVKVLMG